jgi:hypothetical protein
MISTWNDVPTPARVAIAILAGLVLFFATMTVARGDGQARYGGSIEPIAATDAAAPAVPELGAAASVPKLVVVKKKKRRRPVVAPQPQVDNPPVTPRVDPAPVVTPDPQPPVAPPVSPPNNNNNGDNGGDDGETIIVG